MCAVTSDLIRGPLLSLAWERWRDLWEFLQRPEAELDCETAALLFSTFATLREHGVRFDGRFVILVRILARQARECLDAFFEDAYDAADFEADDPDCEWVPMVDDDLIDLPDLRFVNKGIERASSVLRPTKKAIANGSAGQSKSREATAPNHVAA